MYPLVDFFPFLSPAKFELVYTTSSFVESNLNVIPKSKIWAN